MRLFERALRRARLPVAMSRGFNPRPQISLPAALGVGIEGCSEVLDFELVEWVGPEQVRRRLADELPEGIRIVSLQNVPGKQDRRPAWLSYSVPLLAGHPVSEQAIERVLAAPDLVVQRTRGGRDKTVDIRPFISRIRLRGNELLLLLRFTADGTARPDEVLGALGCRAPEHYLSSKVARTNVSLSSSPASGLNGGGHG